MAEIDIKVQLEQLRTHLGAGKSPSDIMTEMKLDLRAYNFLCRKLRQTMVDELTEMMGPEAWANYAIQQQGVIAQIDAVFDQLKRDAPSSIPALLRTKADIVDRILDRAVSAGLVKLEPETSELDGMDLGELAEHELEEMIKQELKEFDLLKTGTDGGVIDFAKVRERVKADRKKARG